MKNLILLSLIILTITSCKKEEPIVIPVMEIEDYSPYLGTWIGIEDCSTVTKSIDQINFKANNKFDSQNTSPTGTTDGTLSNSFYKIFDNNTAIVIGITLENDTLPYSFEDGNLYIQNQCFERP